jgi:hypothetical protein
MENVHAALALVDVVVDTVVPDSKAIGWKESFPHSLDAAPSLSRGLLGKDRVDHLHDGSTMKRRHFLKLAVGLLVHDHRKGHAREM